MKKHHLTLIILITLATLFFVWRYSTQKSLLGVSTEINNNTSLSPTTSAEQKAIVSINDGDKTLSSDTEIVTETTTAYDLLKKAADKHTLPLQTKQYDFGTFVQSVNGLESTPQQAWIYFINGQSGQVGADKYIVKNGDTIEWKYVTPQ